MPPRSNWFDPIKRKIHGKYPEKKKIVVLTDRWFAYFYLPYCWNYFGTDNWPSVDRTIGGKFLVENMFTSNAHQGSTKRYCTDTRKVIVVQIQATKAKTYHEFRAHLLLSLGLLEMKIDRQCDRKHIALLIRSHCLNQSHTKLTIVCMVLFLSNKFWTKINYICNDWVEMDWVEMENSLHVQMAAC